MKWDEVRRTALAFFFGGSRGIRGWCGVSARRPMTGVVMVHMAVFCPFSLPDLM